MIFALTEAMREPQFEQSKTHLEPLRQEILQHRLYGQLRSLEDLNVFMGYHVFAVWDFMSLLKRLQRDLTCTTLPWLPVGRASTRRFINEIVLGEETDADDAGGYLSHFELYLKAMRETGANTARILQVHELLRAQKPLAQALALAEVPAATAAFVQHTLDMATTAPLHQVAAAFTVGREDLIPDLFRALVKRLHAEAPLKTQTLLFYFERHIHLDEAEHTPLAKAMLMDLCGDDSARWAEAKAAATFALQQRLQLWNAIAQAIS